MHGRIVEWLRNHYKAESPNWCPIERTSTKQDVLDIIQDEIDGIRCEFPFTHDDEVKLDCLTDLFDLIDSIVK